MERRTYRGPDDLEAMQELVMRRTEQLGRGLSIHPGDIPHRIYNGLRRFDPADMVHLWSVDGALVAFGWDWRREGGSDFVYDPAISDAQLRTALDEMATTAAVDARVDVDVVGDDNRMISALEDLGFGFMENAFQLTGRDIGDVALPDSQFTVRSATYDDAEALAAVHAGSFNSRWTGDEYARLMHTPGYDPKRELVAVAPDGRFAGFTVTWHDNRNGVGYFEPVGVHADFHRRGVGSLLMTAGMADMAAHGCTYATVMHDFDDDRSSSFYRSNGFVSIAPVTRWERTTTAR